MKLKRFESIDFNDIDDEEDGEEKVLFLMRHENLLVKSAYYLMEDFDEKTGDLVFYGGIKHKKESVGRFIHLVEDERLNVLNGVMDIIIYSRESDWTRYKYKNIPYHIKNKINI